VTNISALAELTSEVLEKPAHLLAPRSGIRPREGVFGNYRWYGDRFPTTRNAPGGVTVSYYLKEPLDGISVSVVDAAGEEVASLPGAGRAGLNEVTWRLDPTSRDRTPPGKYTAKITVGDETQSRTFDVVYP
jgi:hypothetical protein